MTVTHDVETSWPTPLTEPEPGSDEAFQRAMHRILTNTEEYARRIHWWVRLFGIIWIVIPIIAAIVAFFFIMGVSSSTGLENSSYGRCLDNGYSVSECTRMYSR